MFYVGIIYVSEFVTRTWGGFSLTHMVRDRGKREFVKWFIIAGLSGICLEVLAQWLGKLWFYPYFYPWVYWIILFPGFVFYWFTIVESYLACKVLIDRFVLKRPATQVSAAPYYRWEPAFYKVLGCIGVVLLVWGVLELVKGYALNGGYVWQIRHAVDYAPSLRYVMMAFVGVWLIAELAAFQRGARSFVRGMLHGYWAPVLAIFVASVVLSIVMETQNVPHGHWIYDHWPWPELTLGKVQLSVYGAWPAHYVLFLALPAVTAAIWAALFWGEPGTIDEQNRKQSKQHGRR
jgi:hypothetical protein